MKPYIDLPIYSPRVEPEGRHAVLALPRNQRHFVRINQPGSLDPARFWCWTDFPPNEELETPEYPSPGRPLRAVRLALRNPETLPAGPGRVLAQERRFARATLEDRHSIARYPRWYKWWIKLPTNKRA